MAAASAALAQEEDDAHAHHHHHCLAHPPFEVFRRTSSYLPPA